MNRLALEKAKSRLRLAARAVNDLETIGANPIAFEDHWTDFLIHWKGTYSKVQQAAKDTPQELQWFGGVNRERKQDPLLRWLFEARNDEEHGLVSSAVNLPHRVTFRPHNDAVAHALRVNPDGSIRALDENGNEIAADYGHPQPPESKLNEVTEYDGKRKVAPPTAHQGQSIEPKPLIAAKLGLCWLESLVATAEALQNP
jgi:hypothetical protein